MLASITFSGKLAEPMVIAGLALPAVVAELDELDLLLEPQAPATMAIATKIAVTAPVRRVRIRGVSLIVVFMPSRRPVRAPRPYPVGRIASKRGRPGAGRPG